MEQQQPQPTDEPRIYRQQVPTRPAGRPVAKRRSVAFIVVPIVVIMLVLVGAFVLLLAGRGSKMDENILPLVAPEVGALAPDFEFKDMNTGETVTLASLRGKPVWVNFWATWCPPCRAEMPDMEKIYGEYKDKGLVILGVDVKEDARTVKDFTSSLELTWDFMIDADSAIADRYLVGNLPSHFYVDRNGVIQVVHIGGFSTITGTRHIDPRDYLKKIMGN